MIVADEYHGDGFRTDYAAYKTVAPFIWQKAEESESSGENEDWYKIASARARAAGVLSGAYEYGRIDSDGRDDCRALLRAAPNADAYAVDVEAHFNETVPPSVVIAWCRQFEDEFYNLVQDKPLIAYGRSYFVAKHVPWTACFKHVLTLGWVPRYNGSTLNTGNMGNTEADFGLPADKVGLWQFTDGTFGPAPHTLKGLNRNEDLSLLLVPLERITGGTGGGGGDEMSDYADGWNARKNAAAPNPALPDGKPELFNVGWHAQDRLLALEAEKPTPGPAGPRGPAGPPGPAGPAGKAAVLAKGSKLQIIEQ